MRTTARQLINAERQKEMAGRASASSARNRLLEAEAQIARDTFAQRTLAAYRARKGVVIRNIKLDESEFRQEAANQEAFSSERYILQGPFAQGFLRSERARFFWDFIEAEGFRPFLEKVITMYDEKGNLLEDYRKDWWISSSTS